MKDNEKILIVGGGTAGLAIYSILKKYFNIQIVDKSECLKVPFLYRIPLFIGLIFSKSNKLVSKVNIDVLNGRRVPFFESNCFGGASVINGSVHVIGDKYFWKKFLGIQPEKFERYFGNLYSTIFTTNNEAQKIRLKVQDVDDLDEAFYKALDLFSVDQNQTEFFDTSSCGPIINTVKNLTRSSILDLLGCDPVPMSNKSCVDDIEIQDGKIEGVWIEGQLLSADIVILSSGVVGTNILLNKLLSRGKIPGFSNPNTRGIKDHTNLRINVRSKRDIFALNSLKLPFFKRLIFLLNRANRLRSILRGSGASSAANIDLYEEGQISLRLNLLRFYESGRLGSSGELFDSSTAGFSISLTHVNPHSTGIIGIDGSIKPNYLSDDDDIKFLKDALLYGIKLLGTPPLSEYVDEIIDLEEILASPEDYIKKNFFSGYHLIGGASELIDSDFKVKGINGLYVCDASVFAHFPSSNIHSSVLISANAFAQKFIRRYFK